jgi:hypothetical protein
MPDYGLSLRHIRHRRNPIVLSNHETVTGVLLSCHHSSISIVQRYVKDAATATLRTRLLEVRYKPDDGLLRVTYCFRSAPVSGVFLDLLAAAPLESAGVLDGRVW